MAAKKLYICDCCGKQGESRFQKDWISFRNTGWILIGLGSNLPTQTVGPFMDFCSEACLIEMIKGKKQFGKDRVNAR